MTELNAPHEKNVSVWGSPKALEETNMLESKCSVANTVKAIYGKLANIMAILFFVCIFQSISSTEFCEYHRAVFPFKEPSDEQ